MAIGYDEARHLVSRTGLGTPPAEIAHLAGRDRAEAVDDLLGRLGTTHTTALPAWSAGPPESRRVMMARLGDRREVQKRLRERGLELKAWWLREMVETSSPLTERLVLFWHNHFTSSLRKVRRARLLLRQNQLFRRHAAGSFAELLRAVLKDPAMLVYLDNIRNAAGRPNENLGRELLELFTLGEGNYGEEDVKSAARALTGWTVNRRNGEFRVATWDHDDGPKTFLGRTGKFDGDDLVDVILEQPQCAGYVVGKLWSEFVTTPITSERRDALAAGFARNWSVSELVRRVLLSDEFWDASNRATRIKSPVELIVGTVRTLDLDLPSDRILVRACRALGQDVFDPPNVKGWVGGEQWIESNTLLRRIRLLSRAARFAADTAPDEWLGAVWPDLPTRERAEKTLLAAPPVRPGGASEPKPFLRHILTDPTYQLA